MKKNYFMLAAATMMFAACAETDVINDINEKENAPQAIGFETFANKVTREGEQNGTALNTHHGSFSIWASKKIGDTYKEVYSSDTPGTVTWTESTDVSSWVASPLKYWDKTASNYYFYAAAPVKSDGISWVYNVTSNENHSASYLTLTDYTLSGTNLATATSNLVGTWKEKTGDKDLMVAIPVIKERNFFVPQTTANPAAVDLQFIHILSKLNIAVKKGDDQSLTNVTIKLKTLDVVGLKNKGTFTGNSLKNQDGSTGGVISHWNTANSTQYTDNKLGGYIIEQDGLGLTTSPVYTHEYLIMPQEQPLATGIVNNANVPDNGCAYLHIEYTVSGTENDSEEFEAYYGLADVFGITGRDILAFNEGWQNTLTITISPDVIEFDTENTVWGEFNEGNHPSINIE